MRVQREQSGKLVLLSEPDVRFLVALEIALRRQRFRPERVGERWSCAEAARRLRPDAVVLSDRVEAESAAAVLCALRLWTDTPVLVMLRAGGARAELRYFRLGADDVVLLPASPRVVAARVGRLVARAGRAGEPLVSRIGALEVDRYRNGVSVAGNEVPVTPLEYRLMSALAEAPGRVFSRAELIERAAPESDALERTIDAHVCSLRRKLASAGADRVLETVRGAGYRLAVGALQA